ncbi:MAG: hypothetical protein ABGZ23_08015 [Fuerstiella sp.]
MRQHYPGWDISQGLTDTIGQIVEAWLQRTARVSGKSMTDGHNADTCELRNQTQTTR